MINRSQRRGRNRTHRLRHPAQPPDDAAANQPNDQASVPGTVRGTNNSTRTNNSARSNIGTVRQNSTANQSNGGGGNGSNTGRNDGRSSAHVSAQGSRTARGSATSPESRQRSNSHDSSSTISTKSTKLRSQPSRKSKISGTPSVSNKRFSEMEKKINNLETLHESVEELKAIILGKAGGTDPSLFDSEPRQPLDLHPVEFVSEGTKMTTAPVLFREGDKAWWRYSGDLVRSVEVLECTLPTRIRIHPIYTIECINGQRHDVRHDELFITRDRATTWDRTGKISSESSLLDATDRLDAHAIGGNYPEHMIVQWKNLDASQFKLSTMVTSLKDFKLQSDSIVELKDLMNRISTSITGASKTGLLKLPAISDLSPSTSIRDLWMPPPSHPRYEIAKACYGNIATVISTLLTAKEFASDAPKAKIALATVANGSYDGIEMLDHLLRARIPILGATDFNSYSAIMELQAEDGMQLVDFITKAQDIQARLTMSAHPHEDNSLIERFLTELMKTNIHSFISTTFSTFNKFRKKNANMKRYTADSIDTIATDLIDGKAPEVIYLTNAQRESDSTTQNPSAFRDGLNRHKSRSNFSRLKFAALKIDDDASVDDAADEFTEEERQQAESTATDMFDKLEPDYQGDKKELYNDLVYCAMSQLKSKRRKVCEVCGQGHDTDACWSRGPAFQPELIRRRIEQINLRDGDKPKQPPESKLIPPKSSLSKKSLQFNAMALSDPAVNEQVESIFSTIQDDVANDSLDLTPKMAAINLSGNTTDRGPADVMQIADYSVYNEQDFC